MWSMRACRKRSFTSGARVMGYRTIGNIQRKPFGGQPGAYCGSNRLVIAYVVIATLVETLGITFLACQM